MACSALYWPIKTTATTQWSNKQLRQQALKEKESVKLVLLIGPIIEMATEDFGMCFLFVLQIVPSILRYISYPL